MTVILAGATVLEKCCGSAVVFRNVYHSPLFIALWAVTAVSGLIAVLSRSGFSGRPFTMLIHLSFCVILAGSLVSFLTGRDGAMHLRQGGTPLAEFLTKTGRRVPLPFSVALKEFSIDYYRGTGSPEDYCSRILISDEGETEEFGISMNRICRYRGYRFYQTSYDGDECGSVLSVSYDPYGVPLTYSGYALLLAGLLMFFFQKDSGFRRAWRRVASAGRGVAVMSLLFSGSMILSPAEMYAKGGNGSGNETELSKTVPADVAAGFGRLYVYYNGRVAPMETLARDVTMKLYGKSSWRGLSAVQVLAGWTLFTYDWNEKTAGSVRKRGRDVVELLNSGNLMRIFPERDSLSAASGSERVEWYAASDRLPLEIPADRWLFMRKVMSLASESAALGDWEEVSVIFNRLRDYQIKYAGAEMLPSEKRFDAELLYDRIGIPRIPAMASLTLGILLFILSAAGFTNRWLKIIPYALAVLLAGYLTFVLALRWFVSGHIPMTNGHEVMMLMGWILMLLTLAAARRFPMLLPFGFITGGAAMLVASIGASDPQITSMMPVLSSPLLSLHVACMMVSYSLFGILAMNSAMALIRGRRNSELCESMRDGSLLALYPAVFLLAAGTFLGAVWANVSWGNYWSWDPKEVWALITMLVYMMPLHSGVLKFFRDPKNFHRFCMLAFISVIITYFGVNMLLGGMHSYA